MLTVAHGTFCIVDIADATLQGLTSGAGAFNPVEFCLRLNIVGVGRITISLYGEAKRGLQRQKTIESTVFLKRKRAILSDYIKGLNELAFIYDDQYLLNFTEDLQTSNLYKEVFNKSIELAKKRKTSSEEILKDKGEIDKYFRGDTLL